MKLKTFAHYTEIDALKQKLVDDEITCEQFQELYIECKHKHESLEELKSLDEIKIDLSELEL